MHRTQTRFIQETERPAQPSFLCSPANPARNAPFFLTAALGASLLGTCARPVLAKSHRPKTTDALSGARIAQAQTNKPAADPDKRGDIPPALTVPVGPDKGNSPAPSPGNTPPGAPGTTPTTPGPTTTTPTTPTTATTPTAPVTGPTLPPSTTTEQPVPGSVEAEGREVVNVKVVGNRVVPADSILLKVGTRRGAAYSPNQIRLDINAIDALGFFASVQHQVTPNLEDPNKVDVTFIVVENRVITGFKFTGSSLVPAEDIAKVLQSKTGTVLNHNTINSDVTKIQDLFRSKGYAALVTDVHQADDGAVTFTIQEAKVSSIVLSGLRKTKESLVRRQIRSKPGDIFNQVKLRQDLSRIYDLGFFDEPPTLKVDDDPKNPGTLIVTMVMKEKRTGQFSVGVGFDNRSKVTGFVTVGENNLGGSGKRVSASVEGGGTGGERTFDLDFSDPFIGQKNAGYDVSIFDRRIFREPRSVRLFVPGATEKFFYEEQRKGGRLNYNMPLDLDQKKALLFGFRDETARLFQTSGVGVITPVNLPINASGRVAAPSIGFLRDVRDSRIDPSVGSRQQITLEKGLRFLGGNTIFTKVDLDLRHYLPLMRGATLADPPKLVAAGRLVVGKSFGQLPPFEQYFIGGSDTVRGYDIDEQFGDNQVFGNFELRYRVQKKLQIVGFTDAGTAYGGRFSSNVGSKGLFSVGAGLRLQTPIGPIRLDVGKGSRGVRTHFAIGPTF
ncbi:MAG: BamA/TamA family outer membrane protein [Abitibacteriaceae bacterium]|nr:BamA/TamA family outer membrane protein [Abditibacteriaceae bacterium]